MGLRSASVRLALCAILTGTASAWALSPHDKAVGVQSQQKPNGAFRIEEQGEGDKSGAAILPPLITPPKPARTQGDAGQEHDDGEQKGSEFWPTFLGHKVKISDSALVLLTGVLALYTMRLWRSTEKLWSAGEKQMALTQAALHGAETPYLIPIVRKFDPERDKAPDTGEGFMSYRFRNCGRSPAIILERYHSLGSITRAPTPVPFPPPQGNLFKVEIVGPGDKSEIWRFKPGAVHDWTPADQTRAASLVGQIRYADVFGNQFVTNFCYLRNGWSGNWYASGVPACNARRQLTADEMVIAQARDRMPGQAEA